MKRIFIIIVIHLIAYKCFSQAPYTGGKGDGYAMNQINIEIIGINEINKDNSISIYPNPVKNGGSFKIVLRKHSNKAVDLNLIDISGKIVYTGKINNGDDNIVSVNNMRSGVYILKIIGNNDIIYKKICVY